MLTLARRSLVGLLSAPAIIGCGASQPVTVARLVPSPAAAQSDGAPARLDTLTREQVEAAITVGLREKTAEGLVLGTAANGWRASIQRSAGVAQSIKIVGPFDRVRNAAALHARNYMPFTIDSVQPWMTAPVILMQVEPTAPRDVAGALAPAVTRVVLKASDGAIVQPVEFIPMTRSWANMLGATFQTQGAIATFALDALPKGTFQIIVVTDAGEDRYAVGDNERMSIR